MLAGKQACRQAGNHNNRQTDRNSCRQTGRQAGRQEAPKRPWSPEIHKLELGGSPKHAGRAGKHADGQTSMETDRLAGIHADRKAGRQKRNPQKALRPRNP
jgi:hypothetical protein